MFKLKLSKKLIIVITVVYLVDVLIILSKQNLRILIEHYLSQPIYIINSTKSSILKYNLPVKPKDIYTIALIGDSMTYALKDAEFQLQNFFLPFYQLRKIKILNYGFSSTNILSVSDRLLKSNIYLSENYPPLLKDTVDIFIIESFGNNPLSQFPLETGLQKQNKALNQIIQLIRSKNLNSNIIFLATVAPSKKYGEGVFQLTTEQRSKWIQERKAYIENHINYAKSHSILLLDLYSPTVNLEKNPYISQSDYIHPSMEGITYINKSIAEFVYKNRLLPL